MYRWDGSAWKRQNNIFSYYAQYSQRVSTTSAVVGTNTLNCTALAAGYIRVITNISAWNSITNNTRTWLHGFISSVERCMKNQASPGINGVVSWQGKLVLKAGDYVRAIYEGCVAGDDLYLDVVGYDMEV